MPTTYDLKVTLPDGQVATATGAFAFIPKPVITSITPNSGLASGGTAVVIAGSGFQQGATVLFGTAAATNVVVKSDGTQIDCKTPPQP